MISLGIAPVTDSAAFFATAEQLNRGVQALASSTPGLGFASALLAGQALECYLKAFLASAELSGDDLRNQYGHDLVHLWTDSHAAGLRVEEAPPDWVECLAGLHGKPYYLRYPMRLNGIRLPNQAQVARALVDLEETVRPTVAYA